MTAEERFIQRDRMRYIKNSLAANLALLGILFNVFFFVSICKSDVGNYYYTYMIGVSIIYNLAFMLATFLSSEGVKNYQKGYSYLLLLLGIIQFVRIFIFPTDAHSAMVSLNGVETQVMSDGQFFRVVLYLAVSGVCLLCSAAVNLVRCRALSEHMKALETQNV